MRKGGKGKGGGGGVICDYSPSETPSRNMIIFFGNCFALSLYRMRWVFTMLDKSVIVSLRPSWSRIHGETVSLLTEVAATDTAIEGGIMPLLGGG